MKRFPNAFTLMLGIITLAWGLTFIIPKGTYLRVSDPETGRTMVTPGSYKEVQGESLDIMDLLLAIPAYGLLHELANWIYPEEIEV